MEAPAGSEQRPMNHAGVKLMQSSGAAHKEGQLGQWAGWGAREGCAGLTKDL